jgi:Rrf2 family protein
MFMQLTMTGEYAMRAMIYICSFPAQTNLQISDIALKNDIPDNFLRKIIPLLCKNGMLSSSRGVQGGIKLLKDAKEITPLMIIEAVEGEIALNKCMLGDEFCTNANWCSMHVLWSQTQKTVKEMLASKNLEELARENTERYKKYQHKKINNKTKNKE